MTNTMRAIIILAVSMLVCGYVIGTMSGQASAYEKCEINYSHEVCRNLLR